MDRVNNEQKKHADSSKSRTKTDEQDVQDVSAFFNEFKCDPFDERDQSLRSLQSGIIASEALSADLKSAKQDGQRNVQEFLDERVYSKNKSHDRVARSKRDNFSTLLIEKERGENLKQKTEEMQSKAFASTIRQQ